MVLLVCLDFQWRCQYDTFLYICLLYTSDAADDTPCVDLVKSFPTSIYYLLANFGFDTQKSEPQQRSQQMYQWKSRMEKELPNHARSYKNALDRFGTTESTTLWSEYVPICWRQRCDDWTGNCTLRNWLLTHLNG